MDLFYLSDTTTAFNNKWPQMNEIGMKRLISEHLVNDGLFLVFFFCRLDSKIEGTTASVLETLLLKHQH